MKLAPLIPQPTEVWSQLAAVICADVECEWSEEDPTVVERPIKEGGSR
jgi:hypothetical protein